MITFHFYSTKNGSSIFFPLSFLANITQKKNGIACNSTVVYWLITQAVLFLLYISTK